MQTKFTDIYIKNLRPKDGQYEVFDTKTPGFGLRVSPGGTKSFTLLYRNGQKKKRLKLGKYPDLKLSRARAKATEALRRIAAGEDPQVAKLEERQRHDGFQFSKIVDEYIEKYAKRKTSSSYETGCMAFDNLSGISHAMSDALWRLATGGGFSARQLYTDVDETLLNEVRPIILNGIEDFVQRADLADRSLLLALKPITKADRRPEAEVIREFESDLPRIFGALLDMIAHGFGRLPDVTLPELPRMADFAIWATACETAHWPAGTFMAAYEANRSTAIDSVIEADAVATAIRELLLGVPIWTGTATTLLKIISSTADENQRKDRSWPKTPSHLSGRLRRAVPSLRSVGIEVHTERVGRNRARIIHIERTSDFDAKHQEEEVLDEWDLRNDVDDCDAPE